MEFGKYGTINYKIFDPTGNITALVETQVDPADQPAVGAAIMDREPEVEQVGFVSFAESEAPVNLRMAGGEFCGNAAMCAAALYMAREGMQGEADVKVRVSGAAEALSVSLSRTADNSFDAAVTMPPAVGIDELSFSDGMLQTGSALKLPVVRMEGIAHVIVEPDSGFFGLKDDRILAETLLRSWCGVLGEECLGMMFLDESMAGVSEGRETRAMTPLVYVPGADTMFWENSCASGSAAAGMYLAAEAQGPVDVTFKEPAGNLRVESDFTSGKTVLHGSVVIC